MRQDDLAEADQQKEPEVCSGPGSAGQETSVQEGGQAPSKELPVAAEPPTPSDAMKPREELPADAAPNKEQELPKQEHRICDLEAEVAAKARLVDEFTSELDLTTVELLRTQQELQRLKSRPEPQAEIAATAMLVDEFTSELDLTTTELLRTQQELHLLKSRPEAEQHVMAVAQLGGALLNCLPKDSPDRDPDRSSRAIRRTYGFV